MSLQDKFHDNMIVKTRNGSVIVGLVLRDVRIMLVGLDGSDDTPDLSWLKDGRVWSDQLSPLDIVEVLSTPPTKLVQNVALKAGMFVRKPGGKVFEVLAVHNSAVWLQLQENTPGTVSIYAIRDFEVVGGFDA
jgi:hypothetical protein